MKKKVTKGKKLSITKERLNQLNEAQMNHFLGGRMAAATSYTAGGTCSVIVTWCCA